MARGRLITIGSFDGVHRGHAALLDTTREMGKRRHLKTMALTFEQPPKMVLNPSHPIQLLSTKFEKKHWIQSKGIDEVEFLTFDKKFSKGRPFGFFRQVLLNQYKAKGLVVGLDFRFGQDRSAGASELVRWGEEFEIPVWVISAVRKNGVIISSTNIRKDLSHNHFKRALGQLGHTYLIQGKVRKGRGLGQKLGFPTANLDVNPRKLLPPGVFVVKGWVLSKNRPFKGKSKYWPGVCNIGFRPTVSKTKKMVVEAHFFKKDLKLRGKILILELIHRIRAEKRFKNRDSLVRAIAADIKKAKRFLKK